MSKCFVEGVGGGVPLNFKVVGGTEQPANPNENTIWVNTSNEITSWACSPQSPANPIEGMVWIITALNSDINVEALKKNTIVLYILQVHQYISGAWAVCTCMVYQNGAWADTKYWLVKDGQPVAGTVGSFSAGTPSGWDTRGSVSYNTSAIVLTAAGKGYGIKLTSSKNIASSKYKTAKFDMAASYASSGGTNYLYYIGSANRTSQSSFSRTTLSLDISGITSDVPLELWCTRAGSAGTTQNTYYNVWLE